MNPCQGAESEREEQRGIPQVVPEIIYLQWFGDEDPSCLTEKELNFDADHDQVTWWSEKIYDHDIEYIRKDKHDELLMALVEIAGSNNLTATPQQWANHLQQIALRAIAIKKVQL